MSICKICNIILCELFSLVEYSSR